MRRMRGELGGPWSDDVPPDDWWSKWGLGTGVPVVLALIAVRCIVSGHAILPGTRGTRLQLNGLDATLLGGALLAAGLLMTAHYLWQHVDRLAPFAELAKGVALLGIAGSLFALIGRVIS